MVLVHLAEGFEEIEALTIVDLLRRVDIKVKTVSVTGEKIVKGAHGIGVEADCLFEEVDYDQCQMIVLPGGLPGTYGLRDHKGLNEKILQFNDEGKALAAICAAPMVLGGLGLLKGKKATMYTGMEEYLNGAVAMEDKVVTDGNIITSKGPGTAMLFALEIVRFIKGETIMDNLRKDLLL